MSASALERVATPFVLGRPPETDDELYWLVQAMWGTRIPRTQVCPDHVAPFTAFADAYFGRNSLDPSSPVQSTALWHGSRGLSGKSFMLSILGLTKTFMLGCDANLLGGSLAQSTNIHEHMRAAMEYRNAPFYMVADNTGTKVKLTNGAKIRPLTASQRTVRGPHPALLLLDEIDEMDLPILDAALGQPMPQKNYLDQIVPAYTVMCSTWQNPQGTFTEIMRRSDEQNIPRYAWCVAEGLPVTTQRGEVPIELVTTDDLVLTRQGWKPVQHVTDMGIKPTLTLRTDDAVSLTVTADHLLAVAGGWASADAALTMATVRSDVPVVTAAAQADGGQLLVAPCPPLVLAVGDDLQVLAPDAGPVPAQVVDGHLARHLDAVGSSHDQARDGLGGLATLRRPDVDDRAATTERTAPLGALGLHVHHSSVVSRESSGLRRVYDIGVEGVHEFVVNGVVVHNCYRESANPVDGWLSQEAIAEKKALINKEMWRVEYELGEPAIGNRAFDSDAVEATFSLPMEPLESQESKDFEEYVFATPERDGSYVIAADWAKEQDYTVIAVVRFDRKPYELVYWARLNRRPYPDMIKMFNDKMLAYNAQGEYDRTGLGNVVKDYIDVRAHGFHMGGEARSAMLSEYVNGFERGHMRFPKIATAYVAHKYAQVGDLYSSSQMYHLPDEVCALALAYYRICRSVPAASPITVRKTPEPNRYQKVFEPHIAIREGDVTGPDLLNQDRAISFL